MASNDLEARRTSLEDKIDSLGSWMISFTWPVAIGLFMEFYAVFDVSCTHDWNRLIDRIGLLLVTAGVSGELAIEHKTHGAEHRLREVNTEIEHKSNLALKAADEHIAELDFAIEQERTKRAQIELRQRRSRNRYLDAGEVTALRRVAARFRDQEFFVKTPTPERGVVSEPNQFGDLLDEILRQEGWKHPTPSQHTLGQQHSSSSLSGVQIKCSMSARPAADALSGLFESFGILVNPYAVDPHLGVNLLIIEIGSAG
jgi:hypothetical protein